MHSMVYIYTQVYRHTQIHIHNRNLPSATPHCFHWIHHCSLIVLLVHLKPIHKYSNAYIAQISVFSLASIIARLLTVTLIYINLYYPRKNVFILVRKSRLEQINRPIPSFHPVLEYLKY